MKHVLQSIFFVYIATLISISCDTLKRDWEKAKEKNTIKAFDEFMKKHPSSKYDSIANRNIEELIWKKTVDEGTFDAYRSYLEKYPIGAHIHEINAKVKVSMDWFEFDPLLSLTNDSEVNWRLNVEKLTSSKSILSDGGLWIPDKDSEIDIKGKFTSKSGKLIQEAKFGGIDYCYSDSTEKSIKDWSIILNEGSLIIPIKFITGGKPYNYVNNDFYATALNDSLILVKLNSEMNHRFNLGISSGHQWYFTANYVNTIIETDKGFFRKEKDGWYFRVYNP